MDMSRESFAQHIGVPVQQFDEVMSGTRAVIAEMAWLFSEATVRGRRRLRAGAVPAGLALAYSTGSGSHDHDSHRSGTVESTLLSVHPYARLTLHARLAVWGLFGYGLDAPGAAGALTPYAGVTLAADGARTWRLGTRLRLQPALAVSLEGTRAEPVSAAAEHTLALAATLSW